MPSLFLIRVIRVIRGSLSFSLEQLRDRPAVVGDEVWPAGRVHIFAVQRYAHVLVDGRGQVGGADGAGGDLAAVFLGRADHLAVLQPAARQARGQHVGPVIAAVGAALGADLGRSAE